MFSLCRKEGGGRRSVCCLIRSCRFICVIVTSPQTNHFYFTMFLIILCLLFALYLQFHICSAISEQIYSWHNRLLFLTNDGVFLRVSVSDCNTSNSGTRRSRYSLRRRELCSSQAKKHSKSTQSFAGDSKIERFAFGLEKRKRSGTSTCLASLCIKF